MKYWTKYSFLVFSIFSVVLSSAQELVGNGEILFGAQGVYSLDLDEGVITNLIVDDSISVQDVVGLDNNQLLIAHFNLKPSKFREAISQSNELGKLQPILEGIAPVKIGDAIVYYDAHGNLSISNLDNLTEEQGQRLVDHSIFLPSPVIVVSDHEFLFQGNPESIHEIWKFDLETAQYLYQPNLKQCSIFNAVWISGLKKLLCDVDNERKTSTEKWRLVSPTGHQELVDFGKGENRPVLYIPEMNSIVVQKRGSRLFSGEFSDIYFYNLTSKNMELVKEGVRLSRGILYR